MAWLTRLMQAKPAAIVTQARHNGTGRAEKRMITGAKVTDPLRSARIVTVLTWLWLVADILLGLDCLFTIYALGGLGSPGVSHGQAVLSDQIAVPVGFGSTGLYVLAGAAILRWVYVVNRNAHALGGRMAITPAMNVVWFFVPVFNLWKPFTGVRQSWQATLNPAEPDRVPVPGVMRYWWGAWMISSMLGNISGRLVARAVSAEEIIRANWLMAVSTPVDIAAGVTLLVVVRRLSRLQSRALARAGAPPPAVAAGLGQLGPRPAAP